MFRVANYFLNPLFTHDFLAIKALSSSQKILLHYRSFNFPGNFVVDMLRRPPTSIEMQVEDLELMENEMNRIVSRVRIDGIYNAHFFSLQELIILCFSTNCSMISYFFWFIGFSILDCD